jgi:hypothetical protein
MADIQAEWADLYGRIIRLDCRVDGYGSINRLSLQGRMAGQNHAVDSQVLPREALPT